jgi:hypothetical protein
LGIERGSGGVLTAQNCGDPAEYHGATVRHLTEIIGGQRKENQLIAEQAADKSGPFGGERVKALLQSGKAAKLVRLFSSARKRPALTADELIIFLAIGYLNVSMTGGDVILIRPISLIEIAKLLGMPKETVRRKATRLADIEYVESTAKGIVIRQLSDWCRMLESIN